MNIEQKNNHTIHITYLDGLKGLACFGVMLSHLYLALSWNSSNQFQVGQLITTMSKVFRFLINGNFQVFVFLILSGFFFSKLTEDRVKLCSRIVRRYFRLSLPVCAVCICVYLINKYSLFYNIAMGDLTGNSWLTGFFRTSYTVKGIIKSAFLNIWFFNDSSFNGPFWMLTPLMVGTLIAILLTLLMQYSNHSYFVFLFISALVLLSGQLYIFAVLLGVFVARLPETFRFKKMQINLMKNWINILAFLIGFICAEGIPIYVFNYIGAPAILLPEAYWNCLGAILIIYSILHLQIPQKVLSCKLFNALGKIAFSMYLIHWPVICSFSAYIFIKFWNTTKNFNISFGCTAILSIFVIVALSFLFYYIIEKSTNRVTEKIIQYLYLK